MKITYFRDQENNFGDHINTWLWKELIPECLIEDGITFFGIGSILTSSYTDTKKNVVLGTGIAYDVPPDLTKDWDVKAVRGKLSARLLNLPAEKAITDSAILVREVIKPRENREGVGFMPHISALRVGDWDKVCEKLGLFFLDPRRDSRELCDLISKCEYVIAGAMHCAIVADSLRVPWIPVITSPEINLFKWIEWAESLDLDYEPHLLPPSSTLEFIKSKYLLNKGRDWGMKAFLEEKSGKVSVKNLNKEQLLSEFEKCLEKRKGIVRSEKTISCDLKDIFKSTLVPFVGKFFRPYFQIKATKHLKSILNEDKYLSKEGVSQKRFSEMKNKLENIRQEYSSLD